MQNRTIKWGDVLKIYMSVFDDNLKVLILMIQMCLEK